MQQNKYPWRDSKKKTGIKVCYGIDILSDHVIFETEL